MVLADNIDGGDDLDLIVATMNGNVFCFSTPSPHHPLKVIAEQYRLFVIVGRFYSICLSNLVIPGLEITKSREK